MTTVHDAAIDLLRAHELTTWFGNPGSSELALLQDYPKDFRYVLGLSEIVPVGMADAYAQVTRRPAVVNLHTAPGTGNAMGGIYNAAWNKTPLIVIAGNQRRIMQNQVCLLTDVDATMLPRPFVKWAAEPATASEVPAVLAHAIHIAQTPPMGPVFVSLPMDDMEVELDEHQLGDIAVVRDRKVGHGGNLDAETIADLAARIDGAKTPAIVVSGDVERSGAWDAVVALAEKTHSAVWTAPIPGLSGFPENHPLYQGSLAPGAGWVSQTLEGRDLVLVLGGPAFRYYPWIPGPYLPEGTELIHITSDPDEAARAPMGNALVGDVHRATAALLDAVGDVDRTAPAVRPAASAPTASSVPLAPVDVFATLARVAPDDTLWISEAGSNEPVISSEIRPGHPFSHLSAAGEGLGWGLPASVGAQLGAPDRPVVALMGDGSMHYAIQALWTAARYEIPVTIVVASNTEYGILKQFGEIESTPNVPGLDVPGLDVVGTALSYGVDAHEARSTDELEHLFSAGVADRARPTLINVSTTHAPDVPARP